jgi:hypothetical protein
MPGGGMDAHRPKGRKSDQYDRMGNQRTSPAPSRNGSPNDQSKHLHKSTRKGVGEGATRTISTAPDEIARSTVKTGASQRTDHYTDRGRSWATGGPAPDGKSRSARSYTDK